MSFARARRRPARRRRRRPAPPPALPRLPADVTLPAKAGGPDVEAVYEDVGELDAGSLAGLKALYSDARKRAGVAAGIGAYLYTALAAVVLPDRPRRRARSSASAARARATCSLLSAGHRGVAARRLPHAHEHRRRCVRDLGAILAHGEPDDGIGQGETHRRRRPPHARAAPPSSRARPRRAGDRRPPPQRAARRPQRRARHDSTSAASARPPRPRHEPARAAAGRARRRRRLRARHAQR